jgi:hypothetical protein
MRLSGLKKPVIIKTVMNCDVDYEIEIEIEISLLTKSGPQEGIYK